MPSSPTAVPPHLSTALTLFEQHSLSTDGNRSIQGLCRLVTLIYTRKCAPYLHGDKAPEYSAPSQICPPIFWPLKHDMSLTRITWASFDSWRWIVDHAGEWLKLTLIFSVKMRTQRYAVPVCLNLKLGQGDVTCKIRLWHHPTPFSTNLFLFSWDLSS